MKHVFILAVIFVCSSFAGCSKTAVPVDISKACAVENDGKYFVTSGFLDDKGSIFCSNIGGGRLDCSLDVIASPGGTRVFGAEIEQGSGASEIEELPSGYKKEDIKIHDNSGNVIKLSDKVNLTGKLSVAPDGSVCFMEVDKIEK
ncbi:MAG TPA: hypothetical protein VL325_05725 [Pyrinomonadaceae bacterium]|nr:hypothetical protein [Pyrinomonadaceae bacterium]